MQPGPVHTRLAGVRAAEGPEMGVLSRRTERAMGGWVGGGGFSTREARLKENEHILKLSKIWGVVELNRSFEGN